MNIQTVPLYCHAITVQQFFLFAIVEVRNWCKKWLNVMKNFQNIVETVCW